jgi:hypothetical protein
MPYKGNETLVFRSNAGVTDTIFLLKKDTMIAYPEAQAIINEHTCQLVSIFCKHSDPSPPDHQHRYLENYFVAIDKKLDKRASLDISLLAEDAVFYKISSTRIDSLQNVRFISLQTKMTQYNDVYVIEDEAWMDSFTSRSDFITKVYWSKSKGLVRYDKKANVYWELVAILQPVTK